MDHLNSSFKDLPLLQDFHIDRCLVPRRSYSSIQYDLHHFCDASQSAYGTVSYLRLVWPDGHIHCSFIMAKSRLAPMKQMTIPRLELSAAVLAVNVDGVLQRELCLDTRSYFWTDSMIVIHYIFSESKRFKTFVANRLILIHNGFTPVQWKHIGTDLNPADDVSRGLSAKQMISSVRWSQWPEFLWKEEACWPEFQIDSNNAPDDCEMKAKVKSCVVVDHDTFPDVLDNLLKRYSSWFSLKKAVAWLLRFKAWFLSGKTSTHDTTLQVYELLAAEVEIVKYIQNIHYAEELSMLGHGETISRKSSI